MKWLAVVVICLAPALTTVAQAPDDLTQAIKSLQQEIEATRNEIRQLREAKQAQQKREQLRLAREKQLQQSKESDRGQQRARVAQRRENEAIERQTQIDAQIKDREQTIETNEVWLGQLTPIVLPEVPTAPTQQQKVIASLVLERDALQKKIKRANRRWHCRFLRLGCIGRK